MPVLLADPRELRALADRLGRHAEGVRAVRDRLARTLPSAGWHGNAALAFAAQLGGALGAAGRSAGRVDDAADALRRLAGAWEDLLADLRRAARHAADFGTGAGRLLSDLASHPGSVPSDLAGVVTDAGRLAGDVLSSAADVLGL